MAGELVHVVDDDEAVRDSVEFLLVSAGFTVRLHDTASAVLDALPLVPGACLVTDIRMPGMDGLQLLRQVKAVRSALPVVVMTGHGDVPLAVEAMKLGAADFVEKPFDDDDFVQAIRTAIGGVEQAAADPAARAFMERLGTLSMRERQVLDRLIVGDANKVIALRLEISPRTVEVYRANVMTKMQAASLSDLVRAAVRAGLC